MDEEIDDLGPDFDRELARRDAEIVNGRATGIPVEEVIARWREKRRGNTSPPSSHEHDN